MNNREAMQKAFEAWASDYSGEFDFSTTPHGTYIDHPTYCAFIGFRAALASQAQQPAQEPVAWMNPHGGLLHVRETGLEMANFTIPLYLQSRAQQEPSKDMHEAITLLSAVFDAWENGTDCYDDFDGVSGSFIGKAFNLDDEIFKRCCDLLNRANPPRNVSQVQQEPEKCDTCRKTKEHPMGVYCSNPFHLIPPAPEGDKPCA